MQSKEGHTSFRNQERNLASCDVQSTTLDDAKKCQKKHSYLASPGQSQRNSASVFHLQKLNGKTGPPGYRNVHLLDILG